MEIISLGVAVLFGNLLTVSFVWGAHRMSMVSKWEDLPWLAYAAVLFPLFFFLAVMVSTAGLPPQFDALAAR